MESWDNIPQLSIGSIMASKQNFTFEEGVAFEKRLTWRNKAKRPIDLTGYTAVMEIRASVDNPTILLSLTTENGGIALGGAAGTINIAITEPQVAALPVSCVYKLKMVPPSGLSKYLIEGKITVSPWG